VSRGSVTLGEVARAHRGASRGVRPVRACGQYRLQTLIARHGVDFGVPDLLRLLSDDCPKQKSITAYDRCGIYCPELPSLFLGSGSWRGAL
jgi:hypothetical protein